MTDSSVIIKRLAWGGIAWYDCHALGLCIPRRKFVSNTPGKTLKFIIYFVVYFFGISFVYTVPCD
jgi:hypothetical protein